MIKLKNLSKNYGDFEAVKDISFEVNDGEILGFLGPNGAGKTTTLRMITSYLEKTSGDIQINEFNSEKDSLKIRELIGYMPENNPLYSDMLVYDYLEFMAAMRKIKGNEFKKALKKVVDKCGLHSVVHKSIDELSKGYRQRVGLAQAIIHEPKILILDEPTSGLDPNQILEIRELIISLGKEKTVIISSHILQEVQAVCDRIVIINKGKIVANGTTDELKKNVQGKAKLYIEVIDSEDKISELEETFNISLLSKKKFQNNEIHLTYEFNTKENDIRPEIYNWLKSTEITLLEFHKEHTSLESVFTTLTKEKNEIGEE